MTTRYFEEVAEGEPLPPIVKEITLVRLMMYGAATWDFIRLHYDADYVKERGFPAPFADGQMMGAFLAQLVMDWAGAEAFPTRLSFRNRVMVFPGDTLTCGGKLIRKHQQGEAALVDCQLWIDNQRGERAVEGETTLSLPRRGG